MFSTIRGRLITIAVLVGLATYFLWPRDVSRRVRAPDGTMRDTIETTVPLKKGLDLQGGIHLALEVDESKGIVTDRSGALDRALTIIRARIDEFGVAEPLIQKVGDERIVVELPGLSDPARAKAIVERSAFLEFRITDMQGRFRTALPTIDDALRKAGIRSNEEGGSGVTAVERLLAGDSAADTGEDGSDPDSLDLNGPGPLTSRLFNGSQPGEFLVPEEDFAQVDSLVQLEIVERALPRGIELLWSAEPLSQGARSFRALYAVEERDILTGDYLSDARAQIDQVYNQSIVTFTLTRGGGRVFRRATGQHIGDNMAIVLDGRVQGQPPVIRSQIGQRGQIELGNSSLQQAQDLALVLRAGALPAPLTIVEERTVGPSLGQDSIDKGVRAITIGGILVIVIIGAYYRLAGLLAIAALGFFILFALGGLAMVDATLTLPGLAGFVLSIGMAVDGNVLIFERVREELALNKTIRLAVDAGFKEALRAIIDSNATTLITAGFLFQFGTGPVKGFAVTLTIGIIASLLTAVFVTRTLFLLWLAQKPDMKELPI